jgi:hypothetical protein
VESVSTGLQRTFGNLHIYKYICTCGVVVREGGGLVAIATSIKREKKKKKKSGEKKIEIGKKVIEK